MKKIIMFIMLVIIGITAKAQVNTLTINNTSPCGVWLVFYGSTGPCNTNYVSQAIYFAPGPPVTYVNPTFVPGGMYQGLTPLGATGVFTRVRLLISDPNVPCTPGGGSVTGSGCTGPNTTSQTVETGPPPVCNVCGTVNMDWVAGPPGTANINIY